jgi:hypothetical protein
VLHVVSSTYKARADSLKRITSSFPELEGLKELYRKGERVGGYMYLPYGIRRSILERVKVLAEEAGMTFATCREGMPELNLSSNGVSCDGSHLTRDEAFLTSGDFISDCSLRDDRYGNYRGEDSILWKDIRS